MRKRHHNSPGEKRTDLECYQMHGPVKQEMLIIYKANFLDGKAHQGKLETESASDDQNYIYTFNRQGTCIKKEQFRAESTTVEEYDDEGRPIQNSTYINGTLYNKSVHKYNDAGQRIETLSTNGKGEFSYKSVVTYNDIGQQTENLLYRPTEDKLHERKVYTYRGDVLETNGMKHRKLESIIEYDAKGEVTHRHLVTYDERGNQIESLSEYTAPEKKQYGQRFTQRYNEHNDCVEQIFYNGYGEVKNTYHHSYEYDANGKKIEKPRNIKPYDPFELKPDITEQCENDHHGNWIKKTILYQNKPVNFLVKQITYYGEESETLPPLVHPITQVESKEEIVDTASKPEELKPEDARWLAEGSTNFEVFPVHRYYAMKYNEWPSISEFEDEHIEVYSLIEKLKESLGARIVHSSGFVRYQHERLHTVVLSFPVYWGYLLHIHNINPDYEENFRVPPHVEKGMFNEEQVFFGDIHLLRPSDVSKIRDDYFEDLLFDYLERYSLDKKPEKPFINIVEVSGNSFVMKEHPVDDDFEIRDLDINYGYGFQKFHDELMGRFTKSTKGLVLFHGEPGTGKTYYIRHLLRKMVASRKKVIYMPPNMVDHLVEPGFMTFLTNSVRNWSARGNFCVLLIEDAEPLLAKRQEGVRIQGVTNLLNLSDGLLNDMLNLQIICTFNVDLKKLDSALLRPGRLIARKEFKPLSVLDANLLAQRLGIKHHFTEPATLSEVYSMLKNQNTLIHDVEPDKDTSTFIDDL